MLAALASVRREAQTGATPRIWPLLTCHTTLGRLRSIFMGNMDVPTQSHQTVKMSMVSQCCVGAYSPCTLTWTALRARGKAQQLGTLISGACGVANCSLPESPVRYAYLPARLPANGRAPTSLAPTWCSTTARWRWAASPVTAGSPGGSSARGGARGAAAGAARGQGVGI